MKPLLYLLGIACLSLLVWPKPIITTAKERPTEAASNPLSMPKQCQPGKTSPEPLGWRLKSDKPVRVYFLKGNFSAAETLALSRAINNWNDALAEIDSGLLFVISGERESVATDGATITVTRGIPRGKERVGEIKFFTKPNGTVRMTVVISQTITNTNALTSLMTHELGHAMGLADCYECRRGTTAMAAFKDKVRGNEVYQPSACDKYVVATAFAADAGEQARLSAVKQK